MQLSRRLQVVLEMIPDHTKGFADIGSDHAYLPIAAIQAQKTPYAIAGEVVNGPYQAAKQNVAKEGLSQNITVRLANGLAAIEATDTLSGVTICGMGGRLMTEILNRDQNKLAQLDWMILQPNNSEDEVRTWLAQHQFKLVGERLVKDKGKFYEVLMAKKGQMNLTEQEIRFGPYLLEQKDAVFYERWQNEARKLQVAWEQIPSENVEEKAIVAKRLRQMKEVLGES